MAKKFKIKPLYKTLLLLLAVLMILVSLLAGCGTRGAVARGWAGGVIAGNTLYVGSMTGDIVPVNLTYYPIRAASFSVKGERRIQDDYGSILYSE